MSELIFDAYIQSGTDEYEAAFQDVLPDGTPVIGKLKGLVNNEPPLIIFEETKLDGEGTTIIRTFDHGTPENIRSVFRIPGMAEHFLGMIRAELETLVSREIVNGE